MKLQNYKFRPRLIMSAPHPALAATNRELEREVKKSRLCSSTQFAGSIAESHERLGEPPLLPAGVAERFLIWPPCRISKRLTYANKVCEAGAKREKREPLLVTEN